MNKSNVRVRIAVIALFSIFLVCSSTLLIACNKQDAAESVPATESTVTTVGTEATHETEDNGVIEDDWDEGTKTAETEPANTEPSENEPEETKPTETEPTEETTPQETTPQETTPPPAVTEYEAYLAMSPSEQQAFFASFDSVDAYFAWLNKAKAEYEAMLDAEEIVGGTVDISGILGKEG